MARASLGVKASERCRPVYIDVVQNHANDLCLRVQTHTCCIVVANSRVVEIKPFLLLPRFAAYRIV